MRDGRIAAVGPLDEVRARAAAGVEAVDLAGRTLMPSFIDSHGHLLQHGMLAALVDLEHARSIEEIVAAFRDRLAQREAGDRTPLVGAKYDPQLLAEGRHPTRADLDAVTTELPVFALHRSMHVAVGNSVLVEGAGLTAETPDPEGGRFGRFTDGTPDGYVEEHPAMAAFAALLSPGGGGGLLPAGVADPLRAAELAVSDYLRHGITTAQEGAADPATISGLVAAARSWRARARRRGLPRGAVRDHRLRRARRVRRRLCGPAAAGRIQDDPRRLPSGPLRLDERAVRTDRG